MSLFESYERRIDQIIPVLNKYGIESLEEAKITRTAATTALNAYKPIYDNAKAKYVLGYVLTHPFNKRTYTFLGKWLKYRNQVNRNK